ncbi:MAG: 4-hydroxythreonine-4-phosphate dehydrogenase PdxA, partial [Pseudomonadota bacterium]
MKNKDEEEQAKIAEQPNRHKNSYESLKHFIHPSGAASFAYMETAIAATLEGNFDGIVTGPIAKSAW